MAFRTERFYGDATRSMAAREGVKKELDYGDIIHLNQPKAPLVDKNGNIVEFSAEAQKLGHIAQSRVDFATTMARALAAKRESDAQKANQKKAKAQ